ncbi:MerR family transcriptional regulator [Kitasatospora indigofera]|uniref:MerR family transcriptional regulator n=1 Tax=Kitasatospora indigofera TaxID=67307 RepID=UPI0036C03CEA
MSEGEPRSTAPRSRPEASLSTGGVARLLGVSPTTVRSWERRYGIGPAHRESGHHRRWTPQDVAVLEAMCRLTAKGVPPGEAARAALAAGTSADHVPGLTARVPAPAPSEGVEPVEVAAAGGGRTRRVPGGGGTLPVGPVRPECRGLARAAVRLDTPEVARILRAAINDLGLTTAWSEVMTPALRAAGRKWAADGERFVEVEHLLSWQVSSALRRVADHPAAVGGGPPVLLAGMPGEVHTLALEAVAAGLAERGLPFRMFGPAVPPHALLHAVRRSGPAALVLWSQTRPTADRTLALRAAQTEWGGRGSRTHPVLLPVGPGWAGGAVQDALRPSGLGETVDMLEKIIAS